MYSDEHIDYWGGIFTANHFEARGWRFEAFLAAPRAHLSVLWADADAAPPDPLPLLPAQARVQRRLELQMPVGLIEAMDRDPNIVCRDGTYMEPLHHHAMPWKR